MSTFTTIPTKLLLQPLRSTMAANQKRLSDVQVEASTGRYANVSIALGSRMGSDIGLRLQLANATQALDLASQAKVQASALQESFSSLTALTGNFRSMLTGARTSEGGRSVAAATAKSAISALQESVNTTFNGRYLFSGLNAGEPPLKSYEEVSRQSIISCFVDTFGFPPDDPAAAGLTPAQINGFLNGGFGQLFEDPAWSAGWANAAGETATVKLGSSEEIDVSATANGAFARKMAAAFSVMDVLAQSQIGRAAFEAAADRSLALVSEAQLQIGDEQTRIGVGEARIASGVETLEARKSQFSSAIQAIEGVDSYEAATQANMLMSELEASYALTARISKMSLLSYI